MCPQLVDDDRDSEVATRMGDGDGERDEVGMKNSCRQCGSSIV